MIEKIQTDDSNYQRDINSKALLNNNTNQYSIYQQRKRIAEEQNKKQQEEQSETKMRLAQLEEDMTEIKNLLIEIAGMRKT
jgi:hypothetical protein